MSGISTITRLLAVWLILCAHASAQASSRLSSRFLARGEQALLEIVVTGNRANAAPEIPAVNGIEIRPAGRIPQPPSRRLEQVFGYLISSYETGRHEIPPVKVSIGGAVIRTEPLEFNVFNPDELQWSEAVTGDVRFRYANSFRVLNSRPYNGETVPVEIKIYVPADLRVEDWGIPDFQRDGVTAWRFQPSAMRGQVNLLGRPYVAVTYPSTLTAIRNGTVGIGPATVRLITVQFRLDGGFGQNVAIETHLSVPGLELQSQPLPDGAPAGFENAVGNFTIRTGTEITEVQEGDPVPVEIVVNGSGNLDTLRPPKPADGSGWKLYDATAEPRGDERRELSGSTVFRQFMRPLELKTALPAFQLVYFDPKAKEYRTALSEPIPLQMTAAAAPRTDGIAPPQALATPVERMTDILGLMTPASLTMPAAPHWPSWLGHALGGLAALILIMKALWMRTGHHFRSNPEREARRNALREISNMAKTDDDKGFLMAAGRFIESHVGQAPPPEAREILAERDSRCFRGDMQSANPLGAEKRAAIIRTLRGLVAVVCAMLLMGGGQARADDAETAYNAARYDDAIAKWLKSGNHDSLSPDVLYNIGNACYRAGSPGHAALYYRRALACDPGHQESRQNLRFIERKHGSITVQRPDYQYTLARIPLSTWKGMLWTGTWFCALGLLVFAATRPGARLRVAAVVALVIAPLLAAGGALGWRYFPDDAEFAPITRQAVIIAEKAIIHSEASRTSPEVIDAPPGSLCEVIRESGHWAYISFSNKTRGWVPVELIEPIIPDGAPKPPRIRKPKADGKSA
jgi:hypothetical protein